MFANFAYIVDSTKCPTEIFHSCIYPSSRAVLTNKRNFFNGLQFEVEQASRGLSAIAEVLVCLRIYYLLFIYSFNSSSTVTMT